MAVTLTRRRRSPLRRLCCWSLWASASTVWAAGAAAPFKAPASLSQASTAAIVAPAEPAASEIDDPSKGLLGLRRSARSSALIDGQWVNVGETARGARLVAITRQGVHLSHPDGRREFLALNPDVQWTPHTVRVNEGRP